jgi:hypothetical protein
MINGHQQKILNYLEIDLNERCRYERVVWQLDQVMQRWKMIEVNVWKEQNDLMMVNHKQ